MNTLMGNYNKQFLKKVIQMQWHKARSFFHLLFQRNLLQQSKVNY